MSLFNKHDLDDIEEDKEKEEEKEEEKDETESHMKEENIEENGQGYTIKQKENCLLLKGMATLRLTLICIFLFSFLFFQLSFFIFYSNMYKHFKKFHLFTFGVFIHIKSNDYLKVVLMKDKNTLSKHFVLFFVPKG